MGVAGDLLAAANTAPLAREIEVRAQKLAILERLLYAGSLDGHEAQFVAEFVAYECSRIENTVRALRGLAGSLLLSASGQSPTTN